MHPIKSVAKWLISKAFDPFENVDLTNVVGWHPIGGSSSYGFYKSNQYENGYSSISKLANGFALIEPFTIDKSGNKVASNVLDRLYTPNNQMSAYDFREALAVMSLVHDKVRLQVHHTGTRITAESITGFTFMEGYNTTIVGGKYQYKLQNGETLTDDDVATLKSINPDDISEGFSASRAARRWTTLDDYIADYQRGFFQNGAVPAGQFIITARSSTEYNDIVNKLQEKHRGALKNNNVTYSHRPTDQGGSPLNSQVEWVPFSVQNKDMALKDLFDNVNKKIDSAYGVPASIRGVNDQNTYASVRVDELIFTKYALSPLTLKIWSKFTHELTRITGGLGLAVSYTLDMPIIADEEKVKAEAKQIEANTVTTLVQGGFELDSAIAYVKTGDLDKLEKNEDEDADEPEILDTDEARGTPDQPIDGFSKGLKVKQLTEVDRELYIGQMEGVITSQMIRQVNKAIAQIDAVLASKAIGDTTTEEDQEFTDGMLGVLLPLIGIYGNRTREEGITLILQAGLSTEGIERFEMTDSQKTAYQKYLNKVGTGYAEQTAEEIRTILNRGVTSGFTRQQIENELREVILGNANKYRVTRLARSEVNKTEGRSSVTAMQNISSQTGYKVYKVWTNGGDAPCEFCLSMNGKRVLVSENFVDLGGDFHGVDGGVMHNDFDAAFTCTAHPNDECYPTYQVEGA
jgi:phage portal protein BeeE